MAVDKAIDSAKLDSALMATADAIREKSGESGAIAWDEMRGFEQAVEKIRQGSPSAVPKDVNFYDCDGKCLYSYTLEEAQALTEIPPAPAPMRDFLEFDCWNWTLDQIKSLGRPVEVGVIYKTVDGESRLVLDYDTMAYGPVQLNFSGAVVDIDWGEDSEIERINGTSAGQVTHAYQHTGVYIVRLKVISGELILGISASSPLIGGSAYDFTRYPLREVYVGDNAHVGWQGLVKCIGLEVLSMAKTEESLPNTAIAHCYRLKALILPPACTAIEGASAYAYGMHILSLPPALKTIENRFLHSGNSLSKITLPDGLETIGGSVVTNGNVSRIYIPKSVTSIENSAFNSNRNVLHEIRFLSETPPVLGGSAAFANFESHLVVYVPKGTLDTYKTATNYAHLADYMQEAEE